MILVEAQNLALGATVRGIDLAQRLTAAHIDIIEEALLEDKLLCFPEQTLALDKLLRLGRRFGTLEANIAAATHHPKHPEIFVDAGTTNELRLGGVSGTDWHTDLDHEGNSAKETIVYAQEMPAQGFEQQFLNMELAYDALSYGRKEQLESLKVRHMSATRRPASATAKPAKGKKPAAATYPLVRSHPETGNKALCLVPGDKERVVGLSEDESQALLQELWTHTTQGRFIYNHRWRAGDLLMWDNRCTLHRLILSEPANEGSYQLLGSVVL